ncbi:MAG: hypothetical protein ABW007_02615 [Chitinophagaceae bacterium]
MQQHKHLIALRESVHKKNTAYQPRIHPPVFYSQQDDNELLPDDTPPSGHS